MENRRKFKALSWRVRDLRVSKGATPIPFDLLTQPLCQVSVSVNSSGKKKCNNKQQFIDVTPLRNQCFLMDCRCLYNYERGKKKTLPRLINLRKLHRLFPQIRSALKVSRDAEKVKKKQIEKSEKS